MERQDEIQYTTKIDGFLSFYVFTYFMDNSLSYSQIQLHNFVDDCHFDYITKPLKETLVETLSLSLSLCLELTSFQSLDFILWKSSHKRA